MNMKTVAGVIVAIVIIGGGWYWWTSRQSVTGGEALPTGTASVSGMGSPVSNYVEGNLLLGSDATSTLGTYLIASNGMTLYRYAKDTAGVSNCNGPCAVIWPPYIVSSAAALQNVQAGIPGKVAAITRADGSMQVTYNGKPLYFYGKDAKSGDTTGQNVGKAWFVVKP